MSLGKRFQLRDAGVFFDTKSFGVPKDLGDVSKRLGTNIDYFQANYAILVAITLLYVCYHQQSVFWALALCGGVGYWLFNVRKSAIVISGRTFAEKEILMAFAVVTGTILFYVGNKFLIYSMAFAGLLILLHAGLKKASASARATTAVNDAVN